MATFAVRIRLIKDPDRLAHAPCSSVGSWGDLQIWVSGINLCESSIITGQGMRRLEHVRWYLAPFFRWIVKNWSALLHEYRLPGNLPNLDSRRRWARGFYLSALQLHGDDEQFQVWQEWALRHSIRAASEGGLFPDIFFQRTGDDIEISWGDRVLLGAESVDFLVEPGGAHASVQSVASVLDDVLSWFLKQPELAQFPWYAQLRELVAKRNKEDAETKLAWFLDSSDRPGRLYSLLHKGDSAVSKWTQDHLHDQVLAPMVPAVAMFGALSPEISEEAAATLIGILMSSETDQEEPRELLRLTENIPAWGAASPYDDGYMLAREILEQVEPDPEETFTDVDNIVQSLNVKTIIEHLGAEGPRGVAIAGPNYAPTIVVNKDSGFNVDRGTRFTIAHELCHILFDRNKAKSIVHPSTPWAHPAVEQRANAFAAMFLMPPWRTNIDRNAVDLAREVTQLADDLKVSKGALVHHLANIGEISGEQRDALLAR